jgi:hypothetical protein
LGGTTTLNIEGSNTFVMPFDYNPREAIKEESGTNSIHPLYRDEIAEFERMHRSSEDYQYNPESRPEMNNE